MKKNDLKILAAIVVLIILVFLIWLKVYSDKGNRVEISIDGKLYKELSLDKNERITIENSFGKNELVIENGSIHMSKADCPDHTCIKQGHINKDKQTICCLPHRLVVTVVSSEKSDYDTMAN